MSERDTDRPSLYEQFQRSEQQESIDSQHRNTGTAIRQYEQYNNMNTYSEQQQRHQFEQQHQQQFELQHQQQSEHQQQQQQQQQQ